jgi:hypothetical protein
LAEKVDSGYTAAQEQVFVFGGAWQLNNLAETCFEFSAFGNRSPRTLYLRQ